MRTSWDAGGPLPEPTQLASKREQRLMEPIRWRGGEVPGKSFHVFHVLDPCRCARSKVFLTLHTGEASPGIDAALVDRRRRHHNTLARIVLERGLLRDLRLRETRVDLLDFRQDLGSVRKGGRGIPTSVRRRTRGDRKDMRGNGKRPRPTDSLCAQRTSGDCVRMTGDANAGACLNTETNSPRNTETCACQGSRAWVK